MRSISREDVPVVIDDNGVEVRLRDEDGFSVGFVRLPAGADLRPATRGLPHDLCRRRRVRVMLERIGLDAEVLAWQSKPAAWANPRQAARRRWWWCDERGQRRDAHARHATVLPLGADLGAQLQRVERAAGVRRQL